MSTICDEYGQKRKEREGLDVKDYSIKQNGGLSDTHNFGFKECTN